jgi:hypothetical protein
MSIIIDKLLPIVQCLLIRFAADRMIEVEVARK